MGDEEQNGIEQARTKKDDLKRMISHFYGEINRIKKGEERKYQFPITVETCMETVAQCYEYIDAVDLLHNENPGDSDDYEIELKTASLFLTDIEAFSHELGGKPAEILTDKNAVQVSSPGDTKGKEKRKAPHPKAKAEIKSVISGQDVSKEELYQVREKTEEPSGNKTEEAEDAVTAEAAFEISPPREEINEGPPPETEDAPASPPAASAKEELEIMQPRDGDEINLQVVVDKDEKDLSGMAGDDAAGNVSDNVPFLTGEDTDEIDNINIDDIELINDEEGGKKKPEDIDFPEDVAERNIKSVSRNKRNSFKAILQKKNVDEKVISAIKLFPYNENDEAIKREYLLSRNNMIASPNVSRVYLLMSGYVIDVSSFGNWDSISLERVVRNQSYDFVDKELIILKTIYDHIEYFSYSQNKPSYEEWLGTVKYPDYDSLFYALFDANYQGINYFRISCPDCGNQNVIVGRENKEIVVAIDRNYSNDELVQHITSKDAVKLDSQAHLPRWANTTKIRKMTKNTKILFEYMVPTLLDYVEMLSTAKRIAQRDNRPLDLRKILEPGGDDYSRLLLYLYVKTVGLPSPIYGDPSRPKEPTSYKYVGLTNKADIIEIINSLDIEDYASLFTGEPLQELLLKRSMYYFIKDCECPECKNAVKYVNLDPRKIFFSRTTEAVKNLMI